MRIIGKYSALAFAYSCKETEEALANHLCKHSDHEYDQPDDYEYASKYLHEFAVLFWAGELAGNIYTFPKPLLE